MTNQNQAEKNEIDEGEFNYQKGQTTNFQDINSEYYGYEPKKTPSYEYEGRYYDDSLYEKGYYDIPYDKQVYDKQVYDKQVYDKQAYDKQVYDKQVYDKQVYDKKSFDKQVYDKKSFDKQVYDKKSYDTQTYDTQMMYENGYYESTYNPKEDPYYDLGNYVPYQTYPKVHRESKRKAKQRICSNCSTTSTPSWRRGENGKSLLCNACGLYQKLHGRARPYTVTPNGRTKALKGGYEKTLCVSCNNLYPISEVKGGANTHVCDNCLTNIKNTKGLDYQYYRYGNYYNYYSADVNIDHTLDVNNTIYENIRKDKTEEKD